MATHSSFLAWRIQGKAESGGLPSMGLHRVGHDWSDLAAAALFIQRKPWCWSRSSNSLATWCKEPTQWKRPWCWKDWGQKGKRATENGMVRWHHWLNGHVFEQTQGDSEGQGNSVLQFMGLQRVRQDLVTEQQQVIHSSADSMQAVGYSDLELREDWEL